MKRTIPICGLIWAYLGLPNAIAQPMDEILVTSQRLSESLSTSIYSSVILDREVLTGPSLGLDDALRRVPGFGLFRRQASRAAHPTTQGVSLRGLGPNGAGRTLVLLDGIPQNDPFGGWVEWVHLRPSGIGQASVVRGGGAGQWGNSALAGVVRLDSRALSASTFFADFRAGRGDSFSAYGQGNYAIGSGRFSASAHLSTTDGYFLLSDDQRGPADLKTARDSEGVRLSWRGQTNAGTSWTASARADFDDFQNGSKEAEVDTETYAASFSATNESGSGGPAWEVHVYARHKEFMNVFAAFDAERTNSRPVLEQFDVPSTGVGGSALLRWSDPDAWTIEGGADIRLADGETNENFRNLGQGYTRQRQAGGKQLIAGSFIEGHRQAGNDTLFTVGLRADYWRQSAGLRRETNLTDGSLLVDREFADRDGVTINGRAGVKTNVSETTMLRAAAYSGFRVPTLNELYRPFRVGNDITEANNNLVNERLAGAEVALQWQNTLASAQVTVFRNDLFDPVLNATLTTTPGFNADFGVFIPNGGSLRQRSNIDHVSTWGVETDATVRLSDQVTLSASYLFTDPKVEESRVLPALEGKRLAQVARHQGTVSLSISPVERFRLKTDVLFSSRQFEDDLNTRVLDGGVTVDVLAGYDLTENVELYVAAENLFDNRVEAGVAATGLVTLGPPVFLWMGLRLNY